MKVYIKDLYCCYDCPEYKTGFERCGLTNAAISIKDSKRFIDPTCTLSDSANKLSDELEIQQD